MTRPARGRLATLWPAGSGPSLCLAAATLLALALASCPAAHFYRALIDFPGWTASGGRRISAVTVVNDGLMTGFFFLVSRDVKREALRAAGKRGAVVLLPVLSALAGMLAPALLYLLVTAGAGSRHGWGVPMATDVTFAAAALALARPGAPRLRIFLLTLAVADDVGSIIVIAIAYTNRLHWLWLLVSAALILVLVVVVRDAERRWVWAACCIPLWTSLWAAGVNPTMAGVVLGVVAPVAGTSADRRPWRVPSLERVVNWGIVPVFGFVNAGVHLSGRLGHAAWSSTVFWGIVVAFVIGKPLGIICPVAMSRGGPNWRAISTMEWWGMAQLGGVGFTVALFVNQLAFGSSFTGQLGRLAILVGSLLSAALGMGLLRFVAGRDTQTAVVEAS